MCCNSILLGQRPSPQIWDLCLLISNWGGGGESVVAVVNLCWWKGLVYYDILNLNIGIWNWWKINVLVSYFTLARSEQKILLSLQWLLDFGCTLDFGSRMSCLSWLHSQLYYYNKSVHQDLIPALLYWKVATNTLFTRICKRERLYNELKRKST